MARKKTTEHTKPTTLNYPESNTIKTDEVAPETESGVKILMAEDNLVNQKLTSLLFKKLKLNLDVVNNGAEAVEAVMANSYDLVLMDIQMPVMDGLEASNEIQQKLGDSAPPIVALTANAMDGDREKYLNAGMNSYIAKPLTLGDIKECIEKFITA